MNCVSSPTSSACRTGAGTSLTTVAAVVSKGLPTLVERAGLYHLSAGGATSWFDFARAIIGDVKRPRVVPITTAEYPTPARRPAYGVLATGKFDRTFGIALPTWDDALARCVAERRVTQGVA